MHPVVKLRSLMREMYLHAGEFGENYYGANHPMKPHRLCMTHHLVLGYGLHKHMDVYVSRVWTQPGHGRLLRELSSCRML